MVTDITALPDNLPAIGAWERMVPTGEEAWSNNYYKMYGTERIYKKASFENWLSMVHPEDRPGILDQHKQIETNRDQALKNEFRILHPGGIRWIQEIGSNFYDNDGNLIKMSGIAIDVTEQKAREEQLREAEKKRKEIFAMMGHEFKQPLSVISMAMVCWKKDPSKLPKPLEEIIQEQVLRLDNMLCGLLASVRGDLIDLKLNFVRLDPLQHLEHIVKRTKIQFTKKEHNIVLKSQGEIPEIQADPLWFDQVCENIITNACKYTESRGKIIITAWPENSYLNISIKDNGLGLRPEASRQIFEMYHQENSGGHVLQGGLGIGLATVKRVVEMHGGNISVTSPGIGLGSTFTVRFPLSV
jgi:PAS domain S-box-containing protein